MTLVLNIAAMLIAFVALIAMLNGFLGWVGGLVGLPDVLAPDGLRLGHEPARDRSSGRRSRTPRRSATSSRTRPSSTSSSPSRCSRTSSATLTEKGKIIATFALCGFANFSSIGIQIGGIGGLAPSRKSDLARLGFRALLAGSLVSFMTAAIAGILMG